MAVKSQMYINGEWLDAEEGRSFVSIDPATEETIADVPAASSSDVDRAVQAAKAAMSGPWRDLAPEKRSEMLYKMGDIIEARTEEIAALETLDMGKPLRESRLNVARSVRTFRYYAGAVDKLAGESIPIGPRGFSFTLHEPLGVTAHITPWNYPFANACRSLPTALAAGCTAVVKPASVTPLTTLLLGEIAEAAGVPPGVVNVITGDGRTTGNALAEHKDVRGITFTGSVPTGRRIAETAARNLIPSVLELGGKNPQIIFADADPEIAIAATIRGALTNNGQVCTSVSRVLVERSIYASFVEDLANRVAALRIGPGEGDVDLGPLVSEEHYRTVESFVEAGLKRDGARLVTGGERPAGFERGYFYRPTLFDEVEPSMVIASEEVFGPLLSVIPFDTTEEALAMANGLALGLTSGVFTRDIDRAMMFVRKLEAGMVWVNDWFLSPVQTPHGGVKESGLGREQGMMALTNYTTVKSVGIRF